MLYILKVDSCPSFALVSWLMAYMAPSDSVTAPTHAIAFEEHKLILLDQVIIGVHTIGVPRRLRAIFVNV